MSGGAGRDESTKNHDFRVRYPCERSTETHRRNDAESGEHVHFIKILCAKSDVKNHSGENHS